MRPVCLLMIFLLFTLLYLIIKLKINLLIVLTEEEGYPYLACNDRNAFFTSEKPKNNIHGHVKMYVMH